MKKLGNLNQRFSIYLWTIAGILCGFFIFPIGETIWIRITFVLIVSFLLIVNFLIYNSRSIDQRKIESNTLSKKQYFIIFGVELILVLFVLFIRFDIIKINWWYGMTIWWSMVIYLFLFLMINKEGKKI